MKYTITEKATGNVLLNVDCPSTPDERVRSYAQSDRFCSDPSKHGMSGLYDTWLGSDFDISTPNNTPIERDGFIFEFKDEL